MSAPAAMEKISLQVPATLAGELQRLADANDRTLSAEARRALKAHVEAERAKAGSA